MTVFSEPVAEMWPFPLCLHGNSAWKKALFPETLPFLGCLSWLALSTRHPVECVELPCGLVGQPTPILLPGGSHGPRSLVDCSPGDCKESDMTDATQHVCTHTHTHTHTHRHYIRPWGGCSLTGQRVHSCLLLLLTSLSASAPLSTNSRLEFHLAVIQAATCPSLF